MEKQCDKVYDEKGLSKKIKSEQEQNRVNQRKDILLHWKK